MEPLIRINRTLIAGIVAVAAAWPLAQVPQASAVSLPAGSTALLSGQPSLFDSYAAPVGYADVEANSVSEDGRYVAFTSSSDGLVAGDDDRSTSVYRKDMLTGEVVLVSRRDGANGEPSHGFCWDPAISDDGLRVAFACRSSLDPAADTNAYPDVYVRTLPTGTTTLVSRVSAAGPAGNNRSDAPALSQNGDYVAFTSNATDLVGGGSQSGNVYRRHLPTQETVIVGRRDGATGAPVGASQPSITDDGNLVAFVSGAPVDAADTNAASDVYVRDVSAGTTMLVSRASGAAGAVGNHDSLSPEISGNGLAVAFESHASNFDARDSTPESNIYRRSLGLQRTAVIDINPAGVKSGPGFAPSIDDSSHLIAFVSGATGLDPGDTDPNYDVYVRNFAANTVQVASRAGGPGGAVANRLALSAAISGDGLKVASELARGGITADADPRRQTVIHHDLSTQVTRSVARPPGTVPFVNEGGDSSPASLSADGRFAAFWSDAAALGLPPGPSEGIFVRDRVTGSVTLASRADGPGGAPFAEVGGEAAISADGRRVAFTVSAKEGDIRQVWVRDLAEGRTFLASRADGAGGAAGDGSSGEAKLDADGTRVVFRSYAKNLGDGDTDAIQDIHVRDLTTGATILVSRADGAAGAKGDARSMQPDIDASGMRVAFASEAKNLGDGDTDGRRDVHLRDVGAGTTRLVNSTPAGTKGNSDADAPSIDAAGNRVAFASSATNLGDTTTGGKLFVRDFATDSLAVAERGYAPVISPDGGDLAFADGEGRVLRRDLAAARTELVYRAPAANEALPGDISAAGACVSFGTSETLVGPPRDSYESYLRVFTADCGDVPPGGAGTGAGPGGPGASPLDKVAPVLSDVRLSRRRFRVGRSATPIAATVRRGTVLRFHSTETGTLSIRFDRALPGRRSAGTCRPVRKRPRRRACTAHRRAGALSRHIRAGAGTVALTGRLGRRRMAAGPYRLTLVARDGAGNQSKPVRLGLRIVRAGA